MTEQLEIDRKYMSRALKLAGLAGVKAAPNPMVGAVIVHNNQILGEGYHQVCGEAHAEVNAVNSVENKELLKEATIYVTLEPCAHQGKTPPCADLIAKHQFKRAVVACLDSNDKVAGKGIERMKAAGIDVKIGVLEAEAKHLNRRFFTYMDKKRPYVVLKWAETRDGFMDRLPEERNIGINWITQPRMKLYVHKWRSLEQAIMVGWRTVSNDNPQLDVRKIAWPSPLRFIIDPNGSSDAKAKVYQDGKPTFVITTKEDLNLPEHVKVLTVEKVNSKSILNELYKLNILSVFIEGGAETLKHFIKDGYWDEAFQLIGKSEFDRGIEAPILENKILLESDNVEGDIVNHFRRK